MRHGFQVMDDLFDQSSKLCRPRFALLHQTQHPTEETPFRLQLAGLYGAKVDEQWIKYRRHRPEFFPHFDEVRQAADLVPAAPAGVEDDREHRLQPEVGERTMAPRPFARLRSENLHRILQEA